MAAKKKIALVGATGIAGQQFVAALADHPWFEITRLIGSQRTAGKCYGEALRDQSGARRWWCEVEPPAAILDLEVEQSSEFSGDGVDLVLSAYNAGTKPVDQVRGIPNIPETQEYVRRVRFFHAVYKNGDAKAARSAPAPLVARVDLAGKTLEQIYGVPIVLRDLRTAR